MSENNGIMPVSLADRDLYREQWVDKTVEEIKEDAGNDVDCSLPEEPLRGHVAGYHSTGEVAKGDEVGNLPFQRCEDIHRWDFKKECRNKTSYSYIYHE